MRLSIQIFLGLAIFYLPITFASPAPLPEFSIQTTEIIHGPFKLHPHSMYPHTPLPSPSKPCSDCYLLSMETTLHDQNGTSLPMSSGIWLHHLMQFDDSSDIVCPQLSGHFFYGAGNERPVWRLNTRGNWGYYVSDESEWVTAVEIMNETPFEADVGVTVRYEWVSASTSPSSAGTYKKADLIWLNIGPPCSDGEIDAVPEQRVYLSEEWVSPVSGPILEARGHMHDGGRVITMFVNGEPVCESVQEYGGEGYVDDDGVAHLSGAGVCHEGRIEVGDRLQIIAEIEEENLMRHDGVRDKIMAFMFLYLGVEG